LISASSKSVPKATADMELIEAAKPGLGEKMNEHEKRESV
jgi:hypothetical protein